MKRPVLLGLSLAALVVVAGTASRIFRAPASREVQARPVDIPATGPLSIAAVGDTLLELPLAPEDRERMSGVGDLLRHASLAVANLELNLLAGDNERAARSRRSQKWVYGSARDAAELKRLGLSVIVQANNHATDYGVSGMRDTSRLLEEAGLMHVGSGDDLAAARAPTFAGTGPRRVAILAAASSSSDEARASASHGDVKGRAGLNPLRYAADVTVDPETFATLRAAVPTTAGASPDANQVTLLGTAIKKGSQTTVDVIADQRDVSEILSQIRSARARAEVVVVSVHSHEPSNDSERPADFLRHFARAAIDAGARLVVGHGPHQLRGIEIYNGGAILYSLGKFVYQDPAIRDVPRDAFDAGLDMDSVAMGIAQNPSATRLDVDNDRWWEGLIAVATFERGTLTSLVVHPIDLAGGTTVGRRGTPRLAGPEQAVATLDRLTRLSSPYGTRLQTKNGVAIVDLAAVGR